jgi:hypothetical protein
LRLPIQLSAHRSNSLSGSFPSLLVRRLVLAETDVNRVPQEIVDGPGQVGDLRDEPRLDPMDAGEHEIT